MWSDVTILRDFYGTPLGRRVQRTVLRHLRAIWPDLSGQCLLGIGYAPPYLETFRGEAARVIAAMPARQGVLRWPTRGGNATILTHETELPFADQSVDRLLLIHCLENAQRLRPLMREVWRVLAGNGRLLVVVPNRRGLWARFDHSPFGHGLPYSASQISRLLSESLFIPAHTEFGLFMAPSRWSLLSSADLALENLGRAWFSRLGGVVMVEAVKQLYAGTPLKADELQNSRRYGLVAKPDSGPLGRLRRPAQQKNPLLSHQIGQKWR